MESGDHSSTRKTVESAPLQGDDSFKNAMESRSRRKSKKTVQIIPTSSHRGIERACIVCGKDVSMEKHFSVFKVSVMFYIICLI